MKLIENVWIVLTRSRCAGGDELVCYGDTGFGPMVYRTREQARNAIRVRNKAAGKEEVRRYRWYAEKYARVFWAFLAALALSGAAYAQDVPKVPCDHLVQPCAVFEGWLVTEKIWSLDTDPRTIVGARLQAEVRLKRWRWAVQGDATGVPGEYENGSIETVRAVTGYVAGAYDLWRLPGDVSFGPAFGAGGDVVIEKNDEGVTAGLPKRVTAGLGVRASGRGWWVYAVVGQNQSLPGVAATTAWQVRINDRVASIGNVSAGAGAWTAKTGIAVRWK